jgi:hypothetical protein
MSIIENVADVRRRITAAARGAGRDPGDVTLMAVSKTFSVEHIREAYAAGLRVFGENRVQECIGKARGLRDLQGAEWHMIGHLQSNKAAAAAEVFTAVDSLDSLRLAEKLNASAEKLGRKLEVLIEINVGGETAKSGLAPNSSELEELLAAGLAADRLRFSSAPSELGGCDIVWITYDQPVDEDIERPSPANHLGKLFTRTDERDHVMADQHDVDAGHAPEEPQEPVLDRQI